MKSHWYTASTALLLGAANALNSTEVEALYTEGTTPDTVNIGGLQVSTLSQSLPQGNKLPHTGWKVECSSNTENHSCGDAIDTPANSFWLSEKNNGTESIKLTLGDKEQVVSGVTVVPRLDESTSQIQEHVIELSSDGSTWETVAYGTWWPDTSQKISAFHPKSAKFVRISGPAPDGISISNLEVYTTNLVDPISGGGVWGETIDFPLVPVAAAVDPLSGEVVAWSAWGYKIFTGGKGGKTQTATWSPANRTVTRRAVTNTRHDMFCPGTSLDTNGELIVTGGVDAGQTSIYRPKTDDWFKAKTMVKNRGYQASTTLSDGRIFVIGGSWRGGTSGKDGEVYTPADNTWKLLKNALVSPMLTNDDRDYRQDNHGWLFSWANGSIFQAGPSLAMNWYSALGDDGSTTPAGNRTGDQDAMCGNAVMYEQGKILSFGGSRDYETTRATKNANLITIDKPDTEVAVVKAPDMNFERTFHTSVVLPDGSTFVNGGQLVALPFDESDPVLTPERFVPGGDSGKWVQQSSNTVIRVYHSVALLLPDATVFTGGGGLCGNCTTNHFDAQIYKPAYLFDANGKELSRPRIKSAAPGPLKPGASVTIETNGSVKGASLIRYGSTTHTVNTDQRRISLELSSSGSNTYTFTIPDTPGVAVPGYYMLFVLNNKGVPSHSQRVQVTV